MKALILYFSGTGNTAAVANIMQSALTKSGVQAQAHSIEENIKIVAGSYDLLILGCPKYYECPSQYFIEFVKKSLPVCERVIPTMVFCTQASALMTDYKKLERLLKRKNHHVIVEKSFTVANNLLIFGAFHPCDQETIKNNLKAAALDVEPLVNDLLNSNEKKERVTPALAALEHFVAMSCTKLFPVFAMKYSASAQCTGCGLCAQKCPTGNIVVSGKRPVFGRQCMFCMRCINNCPVNAILYHKKECEQYKPFTKQDGNGDA
jgi:ferredoxin